MYMLDNQRSISTANALKILLLWLPILLWYGLTFAFTHSYDFFHRVDSIYYNAALNWIHGNAVYSDNGFGFAYFPTSAALLSPFSFLSLKAFEIVFRLMSIVLFSAGIYRFASCIAKSNPERTFFLMLLSSILLVQAPFFEGQMHLIITGMMLLGYVAIAQEKWWQSALWLTLAFALKPTSIILYLLAFSLYSKLSVKLIVVTIAVILISFIAQSPHYVFLQYQGFVHNFQIAMHFDKKNPGHWATFFGAIAFYTHKIIPGKIAFLIRIIVALFVFLTCFLAKKKCDKKEIIYFIFALGMCYLMLFNSRTENNDYIMIMPIIGFSLSLAVNNKKYWQVGFHILVIALMMLNWNLCKIISPHNNLWLNPTIVLVYVVYVVCLVARPCFGHCVPCTRASV